MKLIHKENYKNYVIGLISLIISAVVYPRLPDQIPIHFNAEGIADGYGSPATIFLFPAIIIGLCILAEVLKHADPKVSNYSIFEKHYYLFHFVVVMFLFLVHLYMVSYSLELITFNISNIMIVLLGLLFIFVGNFMPKIKQNYFMGIKTPWTLANEQVWYDTHRFSGKLWFIIGILICVCGFLPSGAFLPVILTGTLIAAFVPMIYSYILFKRHNINEE